MNYSYVEGLGKGIPPDKLILVIIFCAITIGILGFIIKYANKKHKN